MDIAERYLAHLRLNLMDLEAPHVTLDYTDRRRYQLQEALEGRCRTAQAITMIGEARLVHLQQAITHILQRRVPGDLVEAGAWRGGACIYMRACLDVLGCRDRIVYACDAFDAGFPAPDAKYPVDADSQLHTRQYFKTSNQRVREYVKCYGYDDAQLQLVPGYFAETLPTLPVRSLALLRLDGDLYESNWTPLNLLYDKVSVGGYVIVDDYHVIVNTQMAVDDFRRARRIEEPLCQYDWASAYWVKEAR